MKRLATPLSRRLLIWCLLLFVGAGLALFSHAQENGNNNGDQRGIAVVLDVEGAIGPATSDYFLRGLQSARDKNAEIVVVRMDTPGGLDSSMRDMVKGILSSSVPVATYVTPSGARAASAGTYLLYASHVAAMTPATNLGSATPVQMGGTPGMPDEDEPRRPRSGDRQEDNGADGDNANGNGEEAGAEAEEVAEDDVQPLREPRRGDTAMERKVLEDAVAYIRGLAELRGRNADWAEEAVREAVNLTASDALEKNVIDVVAEDIRDLLVQIDGRTVKMDVGERVLNTENLELVEIEPDWRTRLLSVITNPNIAYILMLVGIYGIIFELANPGSIFPGVVGAISLVLALYAFQVLPINYAGLALIILGIAFMIAEAFLPSFGILGIGGVAAFVFGSIILVDETNLHISIPLIGGTALVSAVFFIWVLSKLANLRRKQVTTGREELIGAQGQALKDFSGGSGRVWLHSESWLARSQAPISKGDTVRVTGMDGLTLTVEPVSDQETSTGVAT